MPVNAPSIDLIGTARTDEINVIAGLEGWEHDVRQAVLAIPDDINFIDNQHRLQGCGLESVFVEMVLDGGVFLGALSDESVDSVFGDIEPFPDATMYFVTIGANQPLNVSKSDGPCVCSLCPREIVWMGRERGLECTRN